MAAAHVLLLALRLRREKIATRSLRDRVASVANCVGLRRNISLFRMPKAISPMAFGILRPSVGLPPGFEAKFSVAEQEAVLAHELAHLVAMDPLWFLLADFASALLWWHPLVWWMRRSLHASAELTADEATALVSDGPGALAKCLVSLGKEMTAARGLSWVGINGGFRSKLGKRVERLVRMSGGAKRPSAGWLGAVARIAITILVVPAIVLLIGSFQSAQGQKQDTWRDQFEESWRQSPASVLLLAKRDDEPKSKATNAVENAKLLYELGKLDEAEAILNKVVEDDPSNHRARYYLDLIKEARTMDRWRKMVQERKDQASPIPNATAMTNLVHSDDARQRILSKLENITLNEASYDLPLKEVLVQLQKESQKLDPEGKGVNFMINPKMDSNGVLAPTNNTGAETVGAVATPQHDIGDEVTIRIIPPLKDLRLVNVLDAITMVANKPIRYTVTDYAVVFSPKPAAQDQDQQLLTKTYRVDPKIFVERLKLIVAKTNSTSDARQMIKDYFIAAGIDLSSPKNVFFNDRLGVLLVRASASDLEIIQQAVVLLNWTPPQLIIEARFVELSQEESRSFKLYHVFPMPGTSAAGSTINISSSAATVFSTSIDPLTSGLSGMPIPTPPVVGIMSDAEFRKTINVIEQSTGADILTAPKVTTESGRQAHIGVSDGDKGLSLDVVPEVGPDGFSIQTTAIPSIKTGDQTWQCSASHKIWDGQTLVIVGETTNQPPGEKRVRMVFVTPRIIDPAGNLVHTGDELQEKH